MAFVCDFVPCFKPLDAWKSDDGEIVFRDTGGRFLQLPCGQCIGCRVQRAEDWTVRLMHEAQMHEHSCFVTLTYENSPLSLDYSDFQAFMRRLRLRTDKVRFFCVGEYGSLNWRPHFHAMLFGVDFAMYDDCVVFKESGNFKLFESKTLNDLWGHGFASVGRCDPASAAYCAHYCIAKVNGKDALEHYTRVDPTTGEILVLKPEFARMSLKPGIGFPWYEKFASDLHNNDYAVLRDGRKKKVPRYYMNKLGEADPSAYDAVMYSRYLKSESCDDSPERLLARELCAKARIDFYSKREI